MPNDLGESYYVMVKKNSLTNFVGQNYILSPVKIDQLLLSPLLNPL